MHQEDLAQAFGVRSAFKYREIKGGTYHAIAKLLYGQSSAVIEDVDQLARIAVFDYLVGNCDNHLKNLSVVYTHEALRLAPSYDIVCTTYFEQFSREMGKALGSTRSIDKVSRDDLLLLARDIGMGPKRMKRICAELSEQIIEAIVVAGEAQSAVVESLPYTAKDLIDNITPQLAIVSAV